MSQRAADSGAGLLQQIPDAIIVTDLAGKIKSWNRSAERLYGFTAGEMLGSGIGALYFPDEPGTWKTAVLVPARESAIRDLEVAVRRKDGHRIHVHLRFSGIRSGGGKMQGVVVCSNDITNKKNAHDELRRAHADLLSQVQERTAALKAACSELRESEHNRRIVLASSPGVVYACAARPPYETTFVSDNVERLFGYEPAAFLTAGDLWINHIHPDDRKRAQEFGAGAITADGGTIEYRFARADGKYRWVRDIVATIQDEAGRVIGLAGYVSDISDYVGKEEERRKAERLRIAAETLVSTQEAERRRIARELHDDLMQRVAAFGVDLAVLDRDAAKNITLRRRIRALRRDIVEFSDDLQAIAYELHSSVFQHRGLRAALEQECRLSLRRTGLRVTLDFDPRAEGLSPEIATCIYRIVQEALRNTAQHSAASKAAITVKKNKNAILLRIEDFGKGFDARSSSSRGGLGITSMSERARLLNGSFSIESRVGMGTRIRVLLPLNRGGASAKGTSSAG